MNDFEHGITARAKIEQVLAGARDRFAESVDGTLGIEEEYAICDPATLDLVPAFDRMAAAARDIGATQEIAGELIASEIELRTGRCENYAQLVNELARVRSIAHRLAVASDVLLASCGTHPWADYRAQQIVDTPYYQKLVQRMRWAARRNNTFGLHVHVGVRGADRAAKVATALRSYVPQLLALSASSPFLDGVDTELASSRTMAFSHNFPRAALPPVLNNFADFERLIRWYGDVGAIDSTGQTWWAVRLHPLLGTVELRTFDAQPRMRDTLALAALANGLVVHLCAQHDAGTLPAPVSAEQLEENHWRATCDGTDATLAQLPGTQLRCVRELIGTMVRDAQAASDAAGLGLDEGLRAAQQLAEDGCSAVRQRRQFVLGNDLVATYRTVIEQTMHIDAFDETPA